MQERQKEFIISSDQVTSLNLKELWVYRELLYFFTWRDIKVKYKQTTLGFMWVILQPLLMMLIFTFFFGQMLGVAPEGIPYSVFAFSGLILWNFFSAAVTNAGNSMVSNASIIKKIYFPRLIIPLSSMIGAMVDFAISFIIFILFIILFPAHINLWLLIGCWPLAILLTCIGTLGLGLWLSALMVKYRDFRFIVSFMMQVTFFLTPVVYPMSKININVLKYVLALNPMYGAITLFRVPMSGVHDLVFIAISAAASLVFLMIGFDYFRKTELYFADLA